MSRVNLSGSDLALADLNGADLRGANLSRAVLTEANLSGADLSGADLSGADLTGANLTRVKLVGANIRETNLSQVRLWQTVFISVELSAAKGLEAVNHLGPSHIGLDTIYLSQGKIPLGFLQGCGIPDSFIAFIQSLPARDQSVGFCAISYSNKDEAFAERLHRDLTSQGLRCWLAPEELKTGDRFRIRLDEAIRVYGKLLLVLSENSIESSWIDSEVEAALERERKENTVVLFPIQVDRTLMTTTQSWAVDIRRARRIDDMSNWRNEERYQIAFAELMRNLNPQQTPAQ